MNTVGEFRGFPSKTNFTRIPNSFFSVLLPQIDDLAELKVTLYIFWALYRKKAYPRFITYSELRGDEALMLGIGSELVPDERLRHALEKAVERGTLLSLGMQKDDGEPEVLYFLNTEADQRAIVQIEIGEVQLDGIIRMEPAMVEERPNIFKLYEQHIGLLTPMIAEELKEAENIYPVSWIEDAFRESVMLNKRSWRYISRILERWASQGKEYGGIRENSKEDISPKEYIRKYGHLTRK